MLNRSRQARVYLKFAAHYNVTCLQPSITHAAMFVKFLGNSFTSPNSVKNYLSGAKTWISHHGGNFASFEAPVTLSVLKWLIKVSPHVPSPAPPLTPSLLHSVILFFDSHSFIPVAFKAALLLGYTCMLRASNLLSPSISAWGGPHTLLARDVLPSPTGLNVVIRSSKILSGVRPTILEVRVVPDSPLCPVAAWYGYKKAINPSPSGPAFLLNNRAPLTPLPLIKVVRLALKKAWVPNFSEFSLHSLRRGAAQAAEAQGAPISDIMSHGT